MQSINTSLRIYSCLIDILGPEINNTPGLYLINMPSLKAHSYVYDSQIRHLDAIGTGITSMDFTISPLNTILSATDCVHHETEVNWAAIYQSIPGGGYAKTSKFYVDSQVIPIGGGTVLFPTGFQYGCYSTSPQNDPFYFLLTGAIVPTVPPLPAKFRVVIDFFVAEHEF